MPFNGPGVDPTTGEYLIAPRMFSDYAFSGDAVATKGFKQSNPGCCCEEPPPPTGNGSVTVRGCIVGTVTALLPGWTVNLKQSGVTLYTETTDGSGVAAFIDTIAGTYDIDIPAHGGYDANTANTIIVPDGGTGSKTVTLSPDSSHVCCEHCTLGIAPKTLYLTDTNGTWTVVSDGSCTYIGEGTVQKNIADVLINDCFGPKDRLVNVGAGTVTYLITVVLTSGGATVANASHFMSGPTTCFPLPTDAFWCGGYTESSCPPIGSGHVNAFVYAEYGTMTGTCNESTVAMSGSTSAGESGPSDKPLAGGSVALAN